ncbi:DUF2987 domain-containing protein [Shewanella maritima]|uniref:DUF2987 domain-containing protein n=1 Tax=Shewanella maritima TaxID=2520507 RepID=A0A411PM37_9GAMM|nr:DUF2987 domain-containing protein [Shewanella maritima]QBF84597.1 DUF2987 domain-containing protein [Shewanella maritima]
MRKAVIVALSVTGLFTTSLFSSVAYSETISLEYNGFYDKLKRAHKSNHPLVDLVFSVPEKPGCKIVSGDIRTEKQQFPLTYNAEQRLFIPYDPQLKSDRALINLTVDGDGKQCGIAVQVRAKSVKQSYSASELTDLMADMDKLLDSLLGFPMKYFSDPVAGIKLQFESELNSVLIDGKSVELEQSMQGEHYSATLTRELIENAKQVEFSQMPTVISPHLN